MIIIEQVFQFLAPHDCISCGKEGRVLCLGCADTKLEFVPDRCYLCLSPSPYGKTCLPCRATSPLRYVRVRTSYGEIAKQVVHALKFTHARDAAKLIAEEMARQLPRFRSNVIIAHVPAASSHVRLRGFDQSALIARELGRIMGLRHMHILGRVGQQRQVGASPMLRRTQLQEVFRPLSKGLTNGAHILLIDDVLTTGSTLEAAAGALRGAGAKAVDAVVFAQAN